MVANISVHEPQPPKDLDSPLAFSMEGYRGPLPLPLIPEFWAPGWNSIQALNKFQEEVGGPLRNERPGIRLIVPHTDTEPHYIGDIPQPFERRTDQWLILPLYHIFGSEELSARSGPIMGRMPTPYLALSAEDAGVQQLAEGQEVSLILGERTFRLPVVFHASIPPGIAGLPVLPALAGVLLPAWGRVRMENAA
jgi:NADH-quinone oxidoreductase subunit G